MTDDPNIKNDDRLAGGGGDFAAYPATFEVRYFTSDGKGWIREEDCAAINAALRQRCEQAEARLNWIAANAEVRWPAPTGGDNVYWPDAGYIGDPLTARIDAALAHDAQQEGK